ncbi:MAG TPA: trypsin-like peptidase domain-containing protein [Chloroflexota bacterium]|nr:trypsin-like peptidase domain-containing protein [Chloroflexota bacterium]
MRRQIFLLVLLVCLVFPTSVLAQNEPLPDYPVPGGHFFSQTGGGDQRGFAITDVDGIPFFTAFRALGGVDALGYPSSGRFEYGGFVSQATQKAILQWRPESGEVVFLNVLDELERLGKNRILLSDHLIPDSIVLPSEAGQPFDRVVAGRLALLDENPAIRTAYFNVSRPIDRYGLPTSRPVDLGNVIVLRAQRAVIQQWKVTVPWARAGQVVFANVGDLAKELELVPAAAVRPQDPAAIVVADVLPRPMVSPDRQRDVIARATAAQTAVVKVISIGRSTGSGILIDAQSGFVVTNSHVDQGGRGYRVTFGDGADIVATLVGSDPLSDLAVLRIPSSRRVGLQFGDSDAVLVEQTVFALGFPPALPRQPALAVGAILGFAPTRPPLNASVRNDLIVSDTPLFPGNSGGPLLTLDGRVIGINSAVIQRRAAPMIRSSLSIASNVAIPMIEELIARGRVSRPYMGINPATVTPSLVSEFRLQVSSGVFVVGVESGSPADRIGIRGGDVITAFGGRPIDDVFDLRAALEASRPGEMVTVRVNRDGARLTFNLVLGEPL